MKRLALIAAIILLPLVAAADYIVDSDGERLVDADGAYLIDSDGNQIGLKKVILRKEP